MFGARPRCSTVPRVTRHGLAVALIATLLSCSQRTASQALPPQAFPAPAALPGIHEQAASEQTFLVDGQRTVLLTPKHSTGRLALYSHGSGETIDTVLQDQQKAPILAGLLQRGFAVAASDDYGANWGNQASVDQLVHVQTVAAKRAHTSRTVLLAQSMGGLDAFLAAPRLRGLDAVVGIFPVCDVQSIWERRSFTAPINVAYGATSESAPAALASRSPVPLPRGTWKGLRLLLFASPTDMVVPKASNADACAAAAAKVGARVTSVTTTGNHGDDSNFQSGRTLAFLDR